MKSLFSILLLMSLTTMTFANNVLPVANITSSSGSFSAKIGQTFTFSGASSYDPDGGGINYYWWYVDGVQKKAGSTASSFTYDPGIVGNGSTNRTFQLMLKVRDNEYSTKTKTVTVTIQADKRNYFVTDHLGNVRATVDQNGAVIGYDDFYPYGQVMPGRSSNTANANDIYKFTGHERDAELGLDYMLARNYDPEIGTMLSIDPLYSMFPNRSPYSYAYNNPLAFTDPTGMAPEETMEEYHVRNEAESAAFAEGASMDFMKGYGVKAVEGFQNSQLKDMTKQFDGDLEYTKIYFSGFRMIYDSKIALGENPLLAYAQKLMFFRSEVNDGAKFDFKNGAYHPDFIGYKSLYRGEEFRYDQYGNYNFGVAARYFGLTLKEAKMGAGMNQMRKLNPDVLNFGGFFDHRMDTEYIIKGYKHKFN